MRNELVLALALLAACVSNTDPQPAPVPAACAAELEAGERKLAEVLGRKPTACERAAARVESLGCASWKGPGPNGRPGDDDDESGAQVCAVVELSALQGVTMAPACVAQACSCRDVDACLQGGP